MPGLAGLEDGVLVLMTRHADDTLVAELMETNGMRVRNIEFGAGLEYADSDVSGNRLLGQLAVLLVVLPVVQLVDYQEGLEAFPTQEESVALQVVLEVLKVVLEVLKEVVKVWLEVLKFRLLVVLLAVLLAVLLVALLVALPLPPPLSPG